MRVAPLTKGVTGVTSGTGIIMELSWMNANPVEGGEFTGDHEWVITYIPSLGPISIHPERPLLDF